MGSVLRASAASSLLHPSASAPFLLDQALGSIGSTMGSTALGEAHPFLPYPPRTIITSIVIFLSVGCMLLGSV